MVPMVEDPPQRNICQVGDIPASSRDPLSVHQLVCQMADVDRLAGRDDRHVTDLDRSRRR
jgi:hypothetical protein